MSYAKFDDPSRKVDAAVRKGNAAFPWESAQRALQGLTNCVLQGTAGTGAFITAGVTGGATSGGKVTYPIDVCIDGIKYAIAAQDNIPMPASSDTFAGSMGTNTVARFLFYAGTDGTAFIAGPGNIILKSDYATQALANAAAKLPDLPDNCVALGYLLLNAPAATGISYMRTGTVSTMGTTAYTDLIRMPMNQ